jgi:hypothetical protein
MEYLAELDFLHVGRIDIRDRAWSKPGVRTAMRLFFKMERAQEELVRVRVEAARLMSWQRIEARCHVEFVNNFDGDRLLLCEIRRVFQYRAAVDGLIQQDLNRLQHQQTRQHLASIDADGMPKPPTIHLGPPLEGQDTDVAGLVESGQGPNDDPTFDQGADAEEADLYTDEGLEGLAAVEEALARSNLD